MYTKRSQKRKKQDRFLERFKNTRYRYLMTDPGLPGSSIVSGFRMGFFEDLFQFFNGIMGINLRGSQAAVP
jgi:hypothetical protein